MSRRKTKYTLRSDGLIMMTKTISGKRKAFYGHSDAEVESKYTEYMKSLETHPEKSVRTFKQVAEDWWEHKENDLSPNSIRGYKAKMNAAVDEFGEYKVNEITPYIIISYLRRLQAQDMSSKTITNSKTVIKDILDDALIAGEITSNPCINLPHIKGKSAVERLPASDADIKKIETTKTDSLMARMFYFMLYTGCRRGEAAALQQKDIHRDQKTATISKTLAYADYKPQIKNTTKTAAGMREVELYDNVLDILPEYSDPETFIFFPDGLPSERHFQVAIDEYKASAGIFCTPHQLRHSFASMLHSAGVEAKDAQDLLGHSSIVVTQDIYTKLEKKHKAAVREQVNEYIKENKL